MTDRRGPAGGGGAGNKAGWLWPGRSPLAGSVPSDGQVVPGWLVHDSTSGRIEIATQLGLNVPTCGLAL